MNLQVGDIVGNCQALGIIQWIDTERAGIENICLTIGRRPLLSSANVLIEELEFIHRPMDFDDKQLMFPFYFQLLRKDEGEAREFMKDYQDKMSRKKGISEHLLHKPKKSIKKEIEKKLKGMKIEDILALLK